MNNNELKNEMISIYNTYEFDWMNFMIYDNDLTYHHIEKAENGGKISINNGALLTTRAHEYLHKIEMIDIDIYLKINEIFKQINSQLSEPTILQRQKIQLYLFEFEVNNVDKLIKKKEKLGKDRIKTAVLRRFTSQIDKE